MDTLQGMCYSGETSSGTLKPENSEITSFGNYFFVTILTLWPLINKFLLTQYSLQHVHAIDLIGVLNFF